MGEIVTVNFRGDQLFGFKQDDGAFIAVKPMCEAMGLAWEPQRKRIQRDPVLSKATSIMEVPFSAHGGQEVTCIRLDRVSFWLAGVDSSRLRDAQVRQKVILYQEECADVLAAHFLGKRLAGAAPELPEPDASRTFGESIRLVSEVRHTWGGQAAREIYVHERLPLTPSMLKAPMQEDLFTTYRAIRNDDEQAAA